MARERERERERERVEYSRAISIGTGPEKRYKNEQVLKKIVTKIQGRNLRGRKRREKDR